MQLYMIRHARSAEQGVAYPNDAKRPLVTKGFRQAEALANLLAKLGVEFDGLYSSPYTRASQTALALLERLKDKQDIVYLDDLATNAYEALLHNLQAETGNSLAIVAHEPYLSEFAAYLLTGHVNGVTVEIRMAALLTLSGKLIAGQMQLDTVIRYYPREFISV